MPAPRFASRPMIRLTLLKDRAAPRSVTDAPDSRMLRQMCHTCAASAVLPDDGVPLAAHRSTASPSRRKKHDHDRPEAHHRPRPRRFRRVRLLERRHRPAAAARRPRGRGREPAAQPAGDAQYVRDVIASIDGPIVLVGHSYGGMVITRGRRGQRRCGRPRLRRRVRAGDGAERVRPLDERTGQHAGRCARRLPRRDRRRRVRDPAGGVPPPVRRRRLRRPGGAHGGDAAPGDAGRAVGGPLHAPARRGRTSRRGTSSATRTSTSPWRCTVPAPSVPRHAGRTRSRAPRTRSPPRSPRPSPRRSPRPAGRTSRASRRTRPDQTPTAFRGGPASGRRRLIPVRKERADASPRPSTRTVIAGELSVEYVDAGDPHAEPVVLLHGFPYDIRSYDEVVPLLVEAGFRVLVPSLRGHGGTRLLDPDAMRSGQQAALGADLLAFLDALELEEPILAGYDWGGRAACVVAALWPERISGLVSVNGYLIQDIAGAGIPLSPALEAGFWYFWYFATERGRTGLAHRRREVAEVIWRRNSPEWDFRSRAPLIGGGVVRHPRVRGRRHPLVPPPSRPRTRRAAVRGPRASARAAAADQRSDGHARRHGRRQLPCDRWIRAGSALHRSAHHIRVPHAGHHLPAEAPRAFADAIVAVAEPPGDGAGTP